MKNYDYGKFSGYANVFNVKDFYDDIVLYGAFKNSLNKEIPLLWEHNTNLDIGQITKLQEDEIGLKVEGKIYQNLKYYDYIKSGSCTGMSIGYIVDDYYFDKKGNRIIKSLDLKEISIVLNPANKFSKILYCKNISDTNFFKDSY